VFGAGSDSWHPLGNQVRTVANSRGPLMPDAKT